MKAVLAHYITAKVCVVLICLAFSTSGQVAQKSRSSALGGVFTPKGDLKVLLIFAAFKDNPESNPKFSNANSRLLRWPVDNSGKGFPKYIDSISGASSPFIYNTNKEFELYREDDTNKSISKYYELMSKGKFRLTADVFSDTNGKPIRVEIDPTGAGHWSQLNNKVFRKMKELNPSFEFCNYDQRTNNPEYKVDNSDIGDRADSSDGKADFVVVIYRYKQGWKHQPIPGMNRWSGSGGGYAAVNGAAFEEPFNGCKLTDGFTMCCGGESPGLFIHEVGHRLYNVPHLFGANSVSGDYFNVGSCGWGATSNKMIFAMNAWERWYAGFIEVETISETSAKGKPATVKLKDYVTTGDAVRVEIPHSGGQYLWIEHHKKNHVFDEHQWAGLVVDKDGNKVGRIDAGTYLMVEAIADSRSKIIPPLSSAANGLKILPADGFYDFVRNDEIIKNKWNNKLYNFTRKKPNPIDGTHPFWNFIDDYNYDGKIDIGGNYNGGAMEGARMGIGREEVEPGLFKNLYMNFGAYAEASEGYRRSPAFQDGDVISLSTNPIISSYAKYDKKNAEKEPTVIAGMKLSFSEDEKGDMFVTVEFGETTFDGKARWCGRISLPNISGDEEADLVLQPKSVLRLDRSGTNNTHLLTEEGDFISPTEFIISAGSKVHLKKKSKIKIKKGSTLLIENGAALIMDKGSKIVIEKGGKLKVMNQENFKKHKRAKVVKR